MWPILSWILSGVVAYLLGSISFGLLIAKAAHGPDLRTVGSGSTGATNMQRTMGWKYGLMTFFGDALKAVLACWLGTIITGNPMAAYLCGLCVVIGHNWPIFFGFKGGKGVAASCGVMVFCFPLAGLICIALTAALIAVCRYVSVGSMFLVTLYALIVSIFYSAGNIWIILWSVVMAALCIYRHRANIARLRNGTENKLGHRATTEGKS